MKRLGTYFTILLLLLVTGFSGISVLILNAHVAPYIKAWLLVVVVSLVVLASLIAGHFMMAPFKKLHLLAQHNQQNGEEVTFASSGTLLEAHQLASDMEFLNSIAKSSSSNLYAQQRRETTFINDVAHELRTPLTAIRGSAEALLDDDMPTDLRQNFCNTIIRESERLTRLTNDLMTLQHIEENTDILHIHPINVRIIADEVAQTLQPLALERNGIVRVSGEAPDVLGNPDRLFQALTNLVSNALRFIPDGGYVDIRLEGVSSTTKIIVADNGSGFGNVNPQDLFTRFFRGDNSRAQATGGAGLGLSIVKSTIENMDGSIVARNRKQGGAEFIITLPALP